MSLFGTAFHLAKPFIHREDAEDAHQLTLRMLKCVPPLPMARPDPHLRQKLFGLDFPNPLGLAPGFDKNAEVPDALLRMGFGFVEVGTVTPRPQPGNPKPRLFRLTEDHAVINRMGFNNAGHRAALRRLQQRRKMGVVGVNIGANKESADRIADYITGITAFSDIADYITVNISSPNTPGLRGLQSPKELEALLQQLNAARATQAKRPAMLLKIAPDLGDAEMAEIADCVKGDVDGVIISNTTLERPALSSVYGTQTGGLSGRPIFTLSTRQLAKFFVLTKGEIPLIGVGGIEDGATALAKIHAGASLLQVYSALVYRGPALITDVLSRLRSAVAEAGSLSALRGLRAEELSHHKDAGR